LKYRSIRDEETRRETWRKSQEKARLAKKCQPTSTPVNTCQHPSTHTDTDTEADTDTKKNTILSAKCPTREIFDAWNGNPLLPKIERITPKRTTAAKTRLADPYFRDNWKAAFEAIPSRPHLMGNNDRGWKATIDWFLQPDSVVRIMEGWYKGKDNNQPELPTGEKVIVTGGRAFKVSQ